MKNKFTSRKFIAMLAGVAGGITLILSGCTMEGTAAIIASVVTYICAEAGIDKAAVKDALENVVEELEGESGEDGKLF